MIYETRNRGDTGVSEKKESAGRKRKERAREKEKKERAKKSYGSFQVRDEDRIIKQSYSGPAEREAIRAYDSPRIFFKTIFRDRPKGDRAASSSLLSLLKVYRRATFLRGPRPFMDFRCRRTLPLKSRIPPSLTSFAFAPRTHGPGSVKSSSSWTVGTPFIRRFSSLDTRVNLRRGVSCFFERRFSRSVRCTTTLNGNVRSLTDYGLISLDYGYGFR